MATLGQDEGHKLFKRADDFARELCPDAVPLLDKEADLILTLGVAKEAVRIANELNASYLEIGRRTVAIQDAKVALFNNYMELVRVGWYEAEKKAVMEILGAYDGRPEPTSMPGGGR